jgi:hypothetical protein
VKTCYFEIPPFSSSFSATHFRSRNGSPACSRSRPPSCCNQSRVSWPAECWLRWVSTSQPKQSTLKNSHFPKILLNLPLAWRLAAERWRWLCENFRAPSRLPSSWFAAPKSPAHCRYCLTSIANRGERKQNKN